MSSSQYYDTITRTPLLTRDEERALLITLRSDDSTPLEKKLARNHLIEANLRFVFKQAKKYSRKIGRAHV